MHSSRRQYKYIRQCCSFHRTLNTTSLLPEHPFKLHGPPGFTCNRHLRHKAGCTELRLQLKHVKTRNLSHIINHYNKNLFWPKAKTSLSTFQGHALPGIVLGWDLRASALCPQPSTPALCESKRFAKDFMGFRWPSNYQTLDWILSEYCTIDTVFVQVFQGQLDTTCFARSQPCHWNLYLRNIHHKSCPIFDVALRWTPHSKSIRREDRGHEKGRLGRMHRYCRAACFEVVIKGMSPLDVRCKQSNLM